MKKTGSDRDWIMTEKGVNDSSPQFIFCMLRYLNTAIMPQYSYQDILTTDADLFLICSQGLITSIVTKIASIC